MCRHKTGTRMLIKNLFLHRETVRVNNINLFYRDTLGDKAPILCLHGRWGRGETWIDLITRYKKEYRIIAPDQRGHGLTEKPDSGYSAKDMARDAYELLKQLNCMPAVIIGHSMGARIAAYLSAHFPEAVKALVIIDENADGSGSSLNDVKPKNKDPLDDGLTTNWPTPYPTYQHAIEHLNNLYSRQTNIQYFLDSLYETSDGYDYLFSRKAMKSIENEYQDFYSLLHSIECPVLFVRAKDSWCLTEQAASKMWSQIKNCTYIEIDNSDHMVYADNADQFYSHLESFLATLDV